MAAVVRRVSNTYNPARVRSSFPYGCSYRTILFFSTDFSRPGDFTPVYIHTGRVTASPRHARRAPRKFCPRKHREKWPSVSTAIGGIRQAFFEKENYKRPSVFDRPRFIVWIVLYNRRRNSSPKCPVNDAHDVRVYVVDLTSTRTAGTTCTTPSPWTTVLPRLSSRRVATILLGNFCWYFLQLIYLIAIREIPDHKKSSHFESTTNVSALSVVVKSLYASSMFPSDQVLPNNNTCCVS